MRFRDARPEPKDGSEDKHTAGQIVAAAFARGGAVRLPRAFGGKDPRRAPMAARYQACLRTVLNEARQAKRLAASLRKLGQSATANQGATS